MKRISYVGGSFVTSDEVAAALLDFIASGTRSRLNQVVTVPESDSAGRLTPISLVLGPSSQLLSQDEPTSFAEPDTSEAAESVRAQARVHNDIARVSEKPSEPEFDDDL